MNSDSFDYNSLGAKLRSFRSVKNYTQEYVADYLGIDQSTYSAMESNSIDWPISRLFKLAKLYSVSPGNFVDFDFKSYMSMSQGNNLQNGNNNRYLNQMDMKMSELYERIIELEKSNVELKYKLDAL